MTNCISETANLFLAYQRTKNTKDDQMYGSFKSRQADKWLGYLENHKKSKWLINLFRFGD